MEQVWHAINLHCYINCIILLIIWIELIFVSHSQVVGSGKHFNRIVRALYFYCKSNTNHKAEYCWMICVFLSDMSAESPFQIFYQLFDKKSWLWLQLTLNKIVYNMWPLHVCSFAPLQNLQRLIRTISKSRNNNQTVNMN